MASKVCSLFFKPNSSDSTQSDSSTDRLAKKINYWAVASDIFLIAGAAATTVGALIISKIILVSGISALALSILAYVKAAKANSISQDKAPKDSEVDTSKTATSKKYDSTAPETIQRNFHTAVQLGSAEHVEEFIKKGADVNEPTNRGDIPLMIAAQNGFTQIMEILIANGADVDIATEKGGTTALMMAAEENNLDAIKILIEKGKATVDKVDKHSKNPISGPLMYNRTALMRAVVLNNAKAVKALIEHGASTERVSAKLNRWTSLLEASVKGITETAIVLIQNGANLDAKDHSGWTSLMWAASMNHLQIVKELIKAGADKTLKHPGGETALDIARYKNYHEIVRILEGKD